MLSITPLTAWGADMRNQPSAAWQGCSVIFFARLKLKRTPFLLNFIINNKLYENKIFVTAFAN
jgi:hypothetical protein